MKENRERWVRPQLIVLGRGTPEENVLAGCKTTTLAGAGAKLSGCRKVFWLWCISTQCSTTSTS